MNRVLLYIFAICMVFVTSCKKEMVCDNPNNIKKISEIYISYNYHYYTSNDQGHTWTLYDSDSFENRLFAVWHWDKDKISSIDHYDESQIDATDNFYYNNEGLVSKIINTYRGAEVGRMEYTYNKAYISHMDYFYQNALESTYDLTYSDNKLSKIACTYLNNVSAKEDVYQYVELTWTGSNVTKSEVFYNNISDSFTTYTYDNKNNPYFGSNAITAYILGWDNPYKLSQNNVLSIVSNVSDETGTYNYSYNNDNYPIQYHELYESIYEDEDYWFRANVEYIYSYNYLEN